MRYLLPCLLAIILFAGCKSNSTGNSTPGSSTSNAQQNRITSFLSQKCTGYFDNDNDIKKNEYFKAYKQQLNNLVDSAGILRNWQGKLSYMSISEPGDNVSLLHMVIDVATDKNHFLKLTTNKYFTTSLLDSSVLYGQLKQLKVGDNVYFDAIIKRDLDKDVKFESLTIFDPLNVCSPDVLFYPISVSKESLANKNSADLEKAIAISWKALNLTADGAAGRAGADSTVKQTLVNYKQQLISLDSSLSSRDKNYMGELIASFQAQYKYK